MARALVRCPKDGDVVVDFRTLVIDDEEHCYRFTCSACGDVIAKACDDGIREVLRTANVPTIDELAEVFASLLNDDRRIWQAILT